MIYILEQEKIHQNLFTIYKKNEKKTQIDMLIYFAIKINII